MKKLAQFLEGHRFTAFFLNRSNFALIYITVCILWFFPLLGWLIDPLSKVCFVWGAGLILWDLLTRRRMFKGVYWALPLLMIAAFGITILLNIQYSFYMGIKHLIYLGISLLILYGQDRKSSFEELKKLLYRLNLIIIGVVFCAGIVSIVMFVFKISFTFYNDDTLLRQGFLENRLFGVYTSPNTGALFVIISLAAMMINSVIKHQGKMKFHWFYYVNLVVQAIYFSLTLSHGGTLTLVAFFILLTVCYIFPKMQAAKGTLKAVGVSLLAVVVLAGGSNVLVQGIQYGMSYVPGFVEMVKQPEEPATPGKTEPQQNKVDFERIESGDDLSNGRITIWTGSLKALRQHPLFGYANMLWDEQDELRFETSDFSASELEWLYRHNGNLHNAYVHIAAYSGIVGITLFLILGLLLVKKVGVVMLRGRKDTVYFSLISLLVCIIGAIAANGMVEAHLLYTRQDPYGAIFWLYVGVTALLAELYQNSDKYYPAGSKHTETFALAADTPFQVLNCMNFVLGNTEACAGKSDIYIYHQFKNSREIAGRLRDSGIFNHVYDVEVQKQRSPFMQKCVTIYRLLLPKKAFRAMAGKQAPVYRTNYQNICVSFPTAMTITLHNAYPRAKVIYLEDGIGSYFGDLTTEYTSRLFKLADRFFANGEWALRADEAYLSNPQLSGNGLSCETHRLPRMENGEKGSLIQTVFDYRENDLYKDSVVYLTQPLEEKEHYLPESEKELAEILRDTQQEKLVVRIHPRQSGWEMPGVTIDAFANLWELECVRQICDGNILIGAFSTAMFMPKILTDMEPVLIFTYRLLFSQYDDPFWKGAEQFIETFRASYRDPSRIYVPKTFDELRELLTSLQDKK